MCVVSDQRDVYTGYLFCIIQIYVFYTDLCFILTTVDRTQTRPRNLTITDLQTESYYTKMNKPLLTCSQLYCLLLIATYFEKCFPSFNKKWKL